MLAHLPFAPIVLLMLLSATGCASQAVVTTDERLPMPKVERTRAVPLQSRAAMPKATCRAIAVASGEREAHQLHFELHNPHGDPIVLPVPEPFLQFEILATAAEGPVEVLQPAVDVGFNEVNVTVPANGTAAVQTPIQLLVRDKATASAERFRWAVPRRAEDVTLRVHLQLPDPFDVSCPVVFQEGA